MDLNPLSIAAELARLLGHGCAPERTAFDDVADLWSAMDAAAEADNAAAHPDFRWAAAWERTDHGTLTHTTASGRMRVEVSGDFFIADLFSPAFAGAARSFFTLEVRDGRIASAAVVAEAREAVERKLDRLNHVGEYLIPAVGGLEEFLEAAEPWTARAVLRARINALEAVVGWHKDPANAGYYAPGLGESLRREAEEELAVYTAKLEEFEAAATE